MDNSSSMYTIYLVSYSQQDFVGAGSRYHLSWAHHSPYEIWVHRWRRNAPWMETLGVLAGINSWVKMGRLSVIRPRNIYEVLVWSWSYGATNWVEGWRVEGWRVEGWRVEGLKDERYECKEERKREFSSCANDSEWVVNLPVYSTLVRVNQAGTVSTYCTA